jgi:hypothetical protein
LLIIPIPVVMGGKAHAWMTMVGPPPPPGPAGAVHVCGMHCAGAPESLPAHSLCLLQIWYAPPEHDCMHEVGPFVAIAGKFSQQM